MALGHHVDPAITARRLSLPLAHYENLDLFADVPAAEPASDLAPPPDNDRLTLDFRRPLDQLDLFADSPAEQSANRARRALKEGAAERARIELAALQDHASYQGFLSDARCCLELIEPADPRWDALASAVPWLELELWPAAERLLGREARTWVQPRLHALLAHCDAGPYDPAQPRMHASYLWHLLGDPASALVAIEADANWHTQAASLVWHAELCQRGGQGARLLADCAELCMAFPDEAEDLLAHNRSLCTHWDRHSEIEPALPVWSFPAWAALTGRLPFSAPAPDDTRPGARLLAAALLLRAAAGADLSLRRVIHSLCPALLQAYLQSRAR